MRITTLIDNEKGELDLISEHGLSMLIELKSGISILFDTGKTSAFIQNAKHLGKDLSQVDFVVLSHGHYDHTGGLETFLQINQKAKIFMKKEALQDKWSMSTGFTREIGFPIKHRVQHFENRISYVDECTLLTDEVRIHPKIEKYFAYNATDQALFLVDGDSFILDPFSDELFLTIKTEDGIVIFTGCAHNGLENIIQSALNQTAENKVKLVVGGAHIHRAKQKQIIKLIDHLNTIPIDYCAFNHCTGQKNISFLRDSLNAEVSYLATGCVYSI